MLPAVGSVRPWADPEVVAFNRLPMRPPTTAFATAADARANPTVDGGDAFVGSRHGSELPGGCESQRSDLSGVVDHSDAVDVGSEGVVGVQHRGERRDPCGIEHVVGV